MELPVSFCAGAHAQFGSGRRQLKDAAEGRSSVPSFANFERSQSRKRNSILCVSTPGLLYLRLSSLSTTEGLKADHR